MPSSTESSKANEPGRPDDSSRVATAGSDESDGFLRADTRPIRCGCGKWLSPRNVTRHNAKAHKIKCSSILVRRRVECPSCHQRVASERFLSHFGQVHLRVNLGQYSQLPIPAFVSFIGLNNAVVVDARSVLRHSHGTASMEELLAVLLSLIRNDQPFHCILDRRLSSCFTSFGLPFLQLFDWLPSEFPLRFSTFDTQTQAAEFVDSLNSRASVTILNGKDKLSAESQAGLNDELDSKSSLSQIQTVDESPPAVGYRELRASSCSVGVLTGQLQEIRKALETKGETQHSWHLDSKESGKLIGAPRPLQRNRRKETTGVNQRHLWAALRAEWEIIQRLRKVVLESVSRGEENGELLAQVRKSSRLHELINIYLECPGASEDIVRRVRQIASIRNKLIHRHDYVRIRNLDAVNERFVELINILDLNQFESTQVETAQLTRPYREDDTALFPIFAQWRLAILAKTIDLSKQIEVLLTEKLSATGQGLKEKLRSVTHLLPTDLRSDIVRFCNQRNSMIHRTESASWNPWTEHRCAEDAIRRLKEFDETEFEDHYWEQEKRRTETSQQLQIETNIARAAQQIESNRRSLENRITRQADEEKANRLKTLNDFAAGRVAAKCIFKIPLVSIFFCPLGPLIAFQKFADYFDSLAAGLVGLSTWFLPGLIVFTCFDWLDPELRGDASLLREKSKRCVRTTILSYTLLSLLFWISQLTFLWR